MLFNSFAFTVFFPLVVLGFFLTPHRWRWLLLLLASYWFYMAWEPVYALLLVTSTIVDHLAARGIAASTDRSVRLRWLRTSLFVNLGLLIGFKYFNFLNDGMRGAWGLAGHRWPVPDLDVLLPMGISFYTFQTMSYTLDVYRGQLEPSRHLGRFALYVSFFPQLVAGPIERAKRLLPQFERVVRPDRERIVAGLKQMLWGFFKKLVIADRAAQLVDLVYSAPGQYDVWSLALATLLFSAQAYGDFSGYSDIAIGAARVLGYDLMVNFRTPFLARSIREFWQRWHISLMTWFRDYLYIPMGGRRGNTGSWYRNLMVVFLISGLWHGAAWTYVLFGALHGVYMIGGIVLAPAAQALDRSIGWSERSFARRAVNVLIVFTLVNLSWVLFRAQDLSDALVVFGRLGGMAGDGRHLAQLAEVAGLGRTAVTLCLVPLFFLVDPWMDRVVKGELRIPGRTLRILIHAAVLAAILLFGYFGEVQFIYFQF